MKVLWQYCLYLDLEIRRGFSERWEKWEEVIKS
jgi:hypothetical protein